MAGGAGQTEMLLNEVKKNNGNLNNILVISHSASNENNEPGKTQQYGDTGSWAQVKKMVDTKGIPNQNKYIYGAEKACGGDKTCDVSDPGMMHYVCYGEEKPTKRKLFN